MLKFPHHVWKVIDFMDENLIYLIWVRHFGSTLFAPKEKKVAWERFHNELNKLRLIARIFDSRMPSTTQCVATERAHAMSSSRAVLIGKANTQPNSYTCQSKNTVRRVLRVQSSHTHKQERLKQRRLLFKRIVSFTNAKRASSLPIWKEILLCIQTVFVCALEKGKCSEGNKVAWNLIDSENLDQLIE